MRHITAGSGSKFAVDDDAYLCLADHRWQSTSTGYAFRWEGRTAVYLHVAIFGLRWTLDPGNVVAFRNGDRSDCRASNLLQKTWCDLAAGRKPRGEYVGISFDPIRQQWKASICYKKRQYWCGRWDTAEAAAMARDCAARLLGGRHVLNFPDQFEYPSEITVRVEARLL
jgi:hypothetical protein